REQSMQPPVLFNKRDLLFAVAAAGALAIASPTRAVTPAPDGGYPSETTAEGDGALSVLDPTSPTAPFGNTAVGYDALFKDGSGAGNTAVGAEALMSNTSGPDNTAIGFQA